jgi:geranylgeranyl diphosphate synthase type II
VQYDLLLSQFSSHLENYRKALSSKQPIELYEPENYILSLDAKRIRPLLTLISCDLFDKDPKQALNAALAIEVFHNFSLIHDDILDKAPLRRGQKTVHEKWNVNVGILSGDVMMVKAFDILNGYDAETLKLLLNIFIKTSVEVCEGQQLDMNFENSSSITVNEYKQMITFKTAVLLGCSLQMGSICAKANAEDQNNCYEFGKHLGIAFQLLDDMLDVYSGDPKKFGKQLGGDILANKKTYLLLKALELANSKQKQDLQNLLSITDAEEKIKGIVAIYDALNIKDLVQEEANKHTNEAIKHLQLINADMNKKKALENMAHALLKREI